jgi:hypothetical protein
MFVEPFFDEPRPSYLASIVILIGHFIGTFVIFSVLLLLAWLIDFGVKYLNAINPFPDALMKTIKKVEIGIFWIDVSVSLVLILSGALSFIKEISSSRR